jgi:hypothetical protein
MSTPIPCPSREDYADFRAFEQALIAWRTPALAEEVAEKYQLFALNDGTFGASVWCWATHDQGYWAVANSCWWLSSLVEARDKVAACHVDHIIRPKASPPVAPMTTDERFAAAAGLHRTSTGGWIDDEEYERMLEIGIDA